MHFDILIIYLNNNIRHIRLNQILRSMRQPFQFVNQCLRDVFPKLQLCRIVLRCEPLKHVYAE